MTDSATPETTAPLPLLSRIIGVITSPKATFQNIVAAPRPVGVLFLVATVIGLGSIAPQFTEKGRVATVEMQKRVIEKMGQTVSPEMETRMEEASHSVPRRLLSLLGTYIVFPIIALIFAAIYWAVVQHSDGWHRDLQTGSGDRHAFAGDRRARHARRDAHHPHVPAR